MQTITAHRRAQPWRMSRIRKGLFSIPESFYMTPARVVFDHGQRPRHTLQHRSKRQGTAFCKFEVAPLVPIDSPVLVTDMIMDGSLVSRS